jgi:hypothetical protein
MAQQLSRLSVYKMNLRAGRTNDDLILIEQRRRLVALVEHVIDALASCRAGKGRVAIHIPSSQRIGVNNCAASISSYDEKNSI